MQNLNKHVNCEDAIRTLISQNLEHSRTYSANNKKTSRQTYSIHNVKVSLFFHIQTLDNYCNSKIPLKAKTRFTNYFVKKKTHNKGKFMEISLKLIGTILQHY